MVKKQKTCVNCGIELFGKRKDTLRCDKCKAKLKAERAKASKEKKRAEGNRLRNKLANGHLLALKKRLQRIQEDINILENNKRDVSLLKKEEVQLKKVLGYQ